MKAVLLEGLREADERSEEVRRAEADLRSERAAADEEGRALDAERQPFEAALEAWRSAKSRGELDDLKGFYSSRFQNQGRDLTQWWPRVEGELRSAGAARDLQLKEVSMLRWRDSQDTMVVTFGEVAQGQTRGVTKRQYWTRERDQWKIFFEGNT